MTDQLANAETPPPLLHPNMAAIYHQRIATLHEQLTHPDTMAEAAEILRKLVVCIDLTPEDGELAIMLRGDLAAILRFATNRKTPGALPEPGILDDLLSAGVYETVQSGKISSAGATRRSRGAKTSLADALEVSQVSLVAGARSANCFAMTRAIIPPCPRIAA